MTQIQARAVENARKEYRRAQNELRVHRLSETRYRGIPTVSSYRTSRASRLFHLSWR